MIPSCRSIQSEQFEERNAWQLVKHARLVSDQLQPKRKSFNSCGFSVETTFISASAVSHRGVVMMCVTYNTENTQVSEVTPPS